MHACRRASPGCPTPCQGRSSWRKRTSKPSWWVPTTVACCLSNSTSEMRKASRKVDSDMGSELGIVAWTGCQYCRLVGKSFSLLSFIVSLSLYPEMPTEMAILFENRLEDSSSFSSFSPFHNSWPAHQFVVLCICPPAGRTRAPQGQAYVNRRFSQHGTTWTATVRSRAERKAEDW